MKTKLTQLFALLIFMISMTVNAQVPTKVGSWNFDDAGDMLKAEMGAALELTGTQLSVPGPVAGNLATEVGTGSYLKLTHGISPNGGGTKVNEYTIMMDVMLPTLGLWHPFFQTDLTNTSDTELWSRGDNTYLGTGSIGYGSKALMEGVWYRMVISVQNGTSFRVYLNTELFLEGNVKAIDDTRYSLEDAILLFADDTPVNDNPVICSEVAVWDLALNESQITELGSVPITSTTDITVSSEGDASTIDTDKGSLQMLTTVLPVDATYQTPIWSVTNGTGIADISPTGLLTAVKDGTVTVNATAKDDPSVIGTMEITLSNQIQVGPVGSWNFDDAGDMLKAEIGAALELTGTQLSVPGPVAGNLATEVGTGSYLKLTHGIAPNGGGTLVNEYTIVMDVQLPTLGGLWHPLLQTDLTNSSDCDLWSRGDNTYLGTSTLGYGDKAMVEGVWYRMAISVKNGTSIQVYLNTELALNGKAQAVDYARTSLLEAVLLFADDTPDKDNPVICSEISIYDVALTEGQVIELGSVPITSTTGITVSGEGDVSIIDTDRGSLQMMAAILPADATYQTPIWSVTDGTGSADISPAGLLSAKGNGTVTVTASAKDDPSVTGTKEITISNQVEELVIIGSWNFDDADDMLKAETGLALELTGTQLSVPGPVAGNLATEVGTGSYLKLTHGIAPNGGGLKVNEYTIVMDVQLPTLGLWHPFLQTDLANSTDCDLWSRGNNTFLGTGTLGYSDKALLEGVWYRMVISVQNGTSFRVYLNTELHLEGNIQAVDHDRYSLEEAILLFADNTPENDNPVVCSEVSIYDVALSEAQVLILGSVPITSTTNVTVSSEGDATIIDSDKGSLQMMAAILPSDATYQTPIWSVTDGTGSADISSTGLLTAKENGTVTVTASAKDDPSVTGTMEITISNQVLTIDDFNMIKDGHFDVDGAIVPGTTLAPNWGGWTGNAGTVSVVNGVCTITPAVAAASWQLQVTQLGNDNDWELVNDVDYVLMFDAWAEAERVISIDFEDKSPDYTRFGTSTDPDANGGTSDWTVDLSTTRTSFSRVFTCTNAIEGSIYKFLISGGAAADVAYFDDIFLMKMADLALAPDVVAVTEINVTGEGDATTIDSNTGTLQMSAAILPSEATIKNIAWSVDDETIATIDSKGLLTAVDYGTVTVLATSQDWDGVSGSLEVTISDPGNGISNMTSKSVEIYPNPALDKLNVTFATSNAKVTIYSSLGRVIEELTTSGTHVIFDVSNYAKGIYFVKVNNEPVVKFIK